MPWYKRYFQHNLLKAIILLLLLILVWQLDAYPGLVERYYTEGIFKIINSTQHLFFSWVPFSLGDIAYIILVICILIVVYKVFIAMLKREFKILLSLLLKVVISLEAIILLFYTLWGINYYRPAAAQLLQLTDTDYTLTDVKAVTRMIIDSTNAARSEITIADLTNSDAIMHQNAVSAIKNMVPLSDKYSVFLPAVKSSLLSPLLNYMGTSGYYNPFTGEAQINNLMPVFDKPFTACHEISHQIGFAHEDEANFVGYIAGVNSRDRLLKYSAYYEASLEFLHYLHRRDTVAHRQLKALFSKGVLEDLKTDSLYWTKYEGALGNVSSRFYDSFLKANQQPAGLRTYNRMIILTMAWYKKCKFY